MDCKIIWFGRYLGCKILDEDKTVKILSIGSYGFFDKIKLILKELKDITEEDLKSIAKNTGNTDSFIRGYIEDNTCFSMHESEELINELRSKGYAIGIPKEYYVSE